MTLPSDTDPIMDAIGHAVTDGRAGNTSTARSALLDLWKTIGATGEPFHRCTLAHYIADLYEDPARALAWDVRAIDAADALVERREENNDTDPDIAGFYPSLHLNLAENYRLLGSFDAAHEHIDAAREHCVALSEDSYGHLVRDAIEDVAETIARRETTRRASAPGPVG